MENVKIIFELRKNIMTLRKIFCVLFFRFSQMIHNYRQNIKTLDQ